MSNDDYTLLYSDQHGNFVKAKKDCLFDVTKIKIKGRSNGIVLEDKVDCQNFSITIGGNFNSILIGEGCRLIGKVAIKGVSQFLTVGKQTTFQSVSLYIGENCSVSIGEDCMFSAKIEIRTTDSHSIYDIDSGKRLNKPSSVTIGNHVWLGKEVIISKGVKLGNNIVVGAKSFVNRSCLDENVILAGAPAKIVKTRVNWTRELLPIDD